MKEFDKKKVGIFLVIIIILAIGIKTNYRLLNNKSKLEEKKEEVIQPKEASQVDKDEAKKDKTEKSEKSEKSEPKEKAKIYIHITGAVNEPGLYKLDEGSRLDDLIKLCKGLKKDADIRKINLSMILEDQMRLHILSIGEADEENEVDNKSLSSDKSGSSKININKASLEELKSLPGIGEKRALDIISYRENNKLTSIEDLKNISGIGEKSISKLKELVVFQ